MIHESVKHEHTILAELVVGIEVFDTPFMQTLLLYVVSVVWARACR